MVNQDWITSSRLIPSQYLAFAVLGTPPKELVVPNAEANAGPTAPMLPLPLDKALSSDEEDVRTGAPVDESLIDVRACGPIPGRPEAPGAVAIPPLPHAP